MKNDKLNVLYIDDEENNLIAFKAAFRYDYNIHLANSAYSGLEIIKHKPIDIVVSDNRMPEATGIDLFAVLKQDYPSIGRILITGYTNAEDLIDSINKGEIFRYLKKPWNELEMRKAINDCHLVMNVKLVLEKEERNLIVAKEEMEKFVRMVTHDLRSPILALREMTNIVHRAKDLNEVQNWTPLIRSSAVKIDEFIVSMHDYYYLRNNQNLPERVNISFLIEDVLSLFEANKRLENVEVTVKDDGYENMYFVTDKVKLKMIISNLISNAFKYQKQDHKHKKILIKAMRNEKGIMTISVEDNGIGIPAEYKERIFEMFFRASSQGQGSGVGLYNVNEAINKLGGTIDVESDEGKFTRFTVSFPEMQDTEGVKKNSKSDTKAESQKLMA